MSTPLLILLFGLAAAATWGAGIVLSRTTDSLDVRLRLGAEIGGLVLLAIAGTLPELAITVSAAAGGHLGLAAGNLIGGIAVQTMVLAVCDLAVGRDQPPLSFLVGSLSPVFEALLVVLVVSGVLMGSLLPASTAIGSVSPASIGIVVVWLGGIFVIDGLRKAPPWQVSMPGSRPGRRHHHDPRPPQARPFASRPIRTVFALFLAACLVTLVAGVTLEVTGNDLANRAGVNGVIFGATVLAVATALPEISSGIAAVRIGDNALAMSDVFGGNAFQVCLFLLADLVAGTPVLPAAGRLNGWLASLGIALTGVYALGVIVRPQRRWLGLGPDSVLAVVLFGLGMAGLFVVHH